MIKNRSKECYSYVVNEKPTNCICTIKENGKLVASLYAVVNTNNLIIPVQMHGRKAKKYIYEMEESMVDYIEELLEKKIINECYALSYDYSPLHHSQWEKFAN